MKRLAIYRAERFSPNSVERDKAIIQEAAAAIGGFAFVREEDLSENEQLATDASLILSMARGKEAMRILERAEEHAIVVNSATAIANCSRSNVDRLMRENNLPAAPLYGDRGWWIKRGDEAAQSKGDVVFAPTPGERISAIGEFRRRGISDLVVTAHVEGDLVKFYGVATTDFFFTCYPTDGSFSKFGDERLNGKASHTPFDRSRMHADADRLARLTGVAVYGGDCIVRPDGSYAIIDFNDWPSFSPCRKEAAAAIAKLVEYIYNTRI